MPSQQPARVEKEVESFAGFDYDSDPSWRAKPLTPAQLLVHDVRLESFRPDRGPLLEVVEQFASNIVPETAANTPSASYIRASDAATTPIERQRFAALEEDYGWMRHLRLLLWQRDADSPSESAKCRWIHCSSKFPEYLPGFLWALSDDQSTISDSLRMLHHTISQQTRYSKHGKYFAPFSQTLRSSSRDNKHDDVYPLLMSVPFLDWTILGSTPPLRFQVDRKEGFASSKSSAHVLRSVLQHFYRLEDTRDREASQVFAKHRPWSTNRELDLKVRQFYGRHPTALNTDELWILAIDATHIVTFSSNQTWKSRWPPLQLTSRVCEVAFRNIRNAYYSSESEREYTATTHAIAVLSGAVGMMHRNFWGDLILPATDRYAGYLGHLQYRLHRAPSTKLVMDLIACQEELNIVIQITQQQIDMISDLYTRLGPAHNEDDQGGQQQAPFPTSRRRPNSTSSPDSLNHKTHFDPTSGITTTVTQDIPTHSSSIHRKATYRPLSLSPLSDPTAQLLDNLSREATDLTDLRDTADRLVTRTIQLVNIRLEDHGKAILVFTVVTIVFLPLNFISSFFGMNLQGIKDVGYGQWLFWAVASAVTVAVGGVSVFVAFYGPAILERVRLWRDGRREVNGSGGGGSSGGVGMSRAKMKWLWKRDEDDHDMVKFKVGDR